VGINWNLWELTGIREGERRKGGGGERGVGEWARDYLVYERAFSQLMCFIHFILCCLTLLLQFPLET